MHKKFFTLIAFFIVSACNPNQPRGYKGPPVSSAHPSPIPTSQSHKIGTSKQIEEARRQAGEIGKQAEAPITKKQLQFGSSAGESKSHSPEPFVDAEGEVFVKPGDPMSEHQIYPATQKEKKP